MILRVLFSCLFGISYSLFCHNRQIDSLQSLINKDTEDTNKVIHLNQLFNHYFLSNNYLKCLELNDDAINLAQKIPYHTGYLQALNKAGIVNGAIGNDAIALSYYFKLLNELEKLKNREQAKANTFNNIGAIYFKQKKTIQAFKYYFQAYTIYLKNNDSINLGGIMHNIGATHALNNDHQKALSWFKSSLKLSEGINDEFNKAICLGSIADTYTSLGEYDKALKYCEWSFQSYLNDNNQNGISLCYNYFGLIYMSLKKVDLAKDYFFKSISICKETHDVETLSDSYLLLAKLDSINNNYQSAFINYKMYILYRDSIYNIDKAEKNMQVSMQYEFDKKQQAKDFETKQTQSSMVVKRNFIIFSLMALSILIVAFFVFKQLKQKQQRLVLEKKLIDNEMNLLRLQINPHLIFNTLNSINAFITSNLNAEAEKYLIKFSKLLRATLNQSSQAYITLQEEFNTLSEYVELEQLRLNHSFKYILNLEETINTSYKIPPLILQPFIENAIIHGIKHKTDDSGLITVNVDKTNELIKISILDNGVGRKQAELINSQKTHKHISRAISITTQRIEFLKGINPKAGISIIDLMSNEGEALGTEVLIYIPIIL